MRTSPIHIAVLAVALTSCSTQEPRRARALPKGVTEASVRRDMIITPTLQSAREADAISRRMRGEAPVRYRLTKPTAGMRAHGAQPGIIIPGVDDLGERK